MAIGLGHMFGFHFPENFNMPYISKSISDFWRRWHISLSSWFRDYVYFPLGGSRVNSKARLVLNLFVVWLLTGVWHGASWNFVMWGLMYFALIAFEKTTGFGRFAENHSFIGHIYTLFFVLIGWVWFRSPGAMYALGYLKSMIGLNGNPLIDKVFLYIIMEFWFTWIIGILGSIGISKLWIKIKISPRAKEVCHIVYLLIVFVLSLAHITGSVYNPFIYFNF